MLRGPLNDPEYRPQFSGHETFPLRYGWLKKAYDAVVAKGNQKENKSVFSPEAIALFGVGKNMVSSMRHWAIATEILGESSNSPLLEPTPLGRMIFGPKGLDPFLENPSSLWLIHWKLCGRPNKTTWFWAFNYFPNVTFDRNILVKGLEDLAKDKGWSRVASSTIRRDVECFVRTYAAKAEMGRGSKEDILESPLIELGLLKSTGKRDGFRFVRGPKDSLGNGVFIYSLLEFWSGYTTALTISFEALLHEPGSPGRVFLLDENDLAIRLNELEGVTKGGIKWSETAGLKQLIRNINFEQEVGLSFARKDFQPLSMKQVA